MHNRKNSRSAQSPSHGVFKMRLQRKHELHDQEGNNARDRRCHNDALWQNGDVNFHDQIIRNKRCVDHKKRQPFQSGFLQVRPESRKKHTPDIALFIAHHLLQHRMHGRERSARRDDRKAEQKSQQIKLSQLRNHRDRTCHSSAFSCTHVHSFSFLKTIMHLVKRITV